MRGEGAERGDKRFQDGVKFPWEICLHEEAMSILRPGQCPSGPRLGLPLTEEQMGEKSRGHAGKARTSF